MATAARGWAATSGANFAMPDASSKYITRGTEYEKCLLHQEVMTVDGVWCAIGSTNFDDRSFEINDEITLGMHNAALARQLEEIFERDTRDCVELECSNQGLI